jgi:hypothetical protein
VVTLTGEASSVTPELNRSNFLFNEGGEQSFPSFAIWEVIMKGTDLKKAVYSLTKDRLWSSDATDTTINDLIVNWVNLAIEEFPPEAFTCNSYPIMDIVANTTDFLPDDFKTLAYCEVYDTDPSTKYDADEFEFTADGQIVYPFDIESADLYYYPIPSFTGVDETIPLIASLHNCLIYFMYAQYYYQSGEGDTEEHRMADNYLARFNNLKDKKLTEVKDKKPSDTPTKTVDALPKRQNGRATRSYFYE